MSLDLAKRRAFLRLPNLTLPTRLFGPAWLYPLFDGAWRGQMLARQSRHRKPRAIAVRIVDKVIGPSGQKIATASASVIASSSPHRSSDGRFRTRARGSRRCIAISSFASRRSCMKRRKAHSHNYPRSRADSLRMRYASADRSSLRPENLVRPNISCPLAISLNALSPGPNRP
jgi:hypothetical protein